MGAGGRPHFSATTSRRRSERPGVIDPKGVEEIGRQNQCGAPQLGQAEGCRSPSGFVRRGASLRPGDRQIESRRVTPPARSPGLPASSITRRAEHRDSSHPRSLLRPPDPAKASGRPDRCADMRETRLRGLGIYKRISYAIAGSDNTRWSDWTSGDLLVRRRSRPRSGTPPGIFDRRHALCRVCAIPTRAGLTCRGQVW